MSETSKTDEKSMSEFLAYHCIPYFQYVVKAKTIRFIDINNFLSLNYLLTLRRIRGSNYGFESDPERHFGDAKLILNYV